MSDVALRDLIYKSPSGKKYTLTYDTVERSGSKKLGVHELPGRNFPIVQDQGNNADKYPLVAYFYGATYRADSDGMVDALKEPGKGTLQHPRYGDIKVVPVTFTQAEDLVDDVGRARVQVEFLRVAAVDPSTKAPDAKADTSAKTAATTDEAVNAAAAEFAPVNAADVAAIKAQTTDWVKDFQNAVRSITQFSEDIQAQVNALVSDILTTIDDLIAAPLELYTSIASLALLPARVVSNVAGKVEAYRSIIVETALNIPGTYTQALNQSVALYCAFGGILESTTTGDYRSRSDAVATIDGLQEAMDAMRDAMTAIDQGTTGYRPDSDTLQAWAELLATVQADIMDTVYSLRQERRVILESDRTPIDFVWEQYGTLDGLEEFMSVNGLSGTDIILMPRGLEVVVYA